MTTLHPDVHASRRATLVLAGLSATILAAAAVWAFNPPAPRPLDAPTLPPPPAGTTAQTTAPLLDAAPFAAKLWPPAPAATTAAAIPMPPAPTPPPVPIELLGIHADPTQPAPRQWLASLYDPEAGRVRVVAPGDTIAGRTVTAIDPLGVTLSAGSSITVLPLNPSGYSR
ncbi:MAG: hypothetical protein ACOYN0_03165 [Phycisphaerales bacterium]